MKINNKNRKYLTICQNRERFNFAEIIFVLKSRIMNFKITWYAHLYLTHSFILKMSASLHCDTILTVDLLRIRSKWTHSRSRCSSSNVLTSVPITQPLYLSAHHNTLLFRLITWKYDTNKKNANSCKNINIFFQIW